MIDVLVAESNFVLREGVKALLSRCDDLQVFAEVRTRAELMVALQYQKIDVLLLDLCLEGGTGEALVRRARRIAPQIPIVGFSSLNGPRLGSRAIHAGLKGYLRKDCSAEDLLCALRRVSNGRAYIDAATAEQLVADLTGDVTELPHLLLSERELDVFRRLVVGENIGIIANQLSLSVKTISTHKVRLLRKMSLPNISRLVQYAVTHHLL